MNLPSSLVLIAKSLLGIEKLIKIRSESWYCCRHHGDDDEPSRVSNTSSEALSSPTGKAHG